MYPYSDRPSYAHAKQQVENYYSYAPSYAYGIRSPYSTPRLNRDTTMAFPSIVPPQPASATPPQRPKLTTSLWEDEGTICYQVDARGICVARRQDNDMVNGTKLLNVTGMSRGKRDGILKNEQGRVVVKVGAMHLKGVWVTFARAKALAEQFKITEDVHPLFVDDPGVYFYTAPVPFPQNMANYYMPSAYLSPSQDIYPSYNNSAASHHQQHQHHHQQHQHQQQPPSSSPSTAADPMHMTTSNTTSVVSTPSQPLPPAPSVPSMISPSMYYKQGASGGLCMPFEAKSDSAGCTVQSVSPSSQICGTPSNYESRPKAAAVAALPHYDMLSGNRPSSSSPYESLYQQHSSAIETHAVTTTTSTTTSTATIAAPTSHMIGYPNRHSGGASSIFSTLTADDSAPTTPANFVSYSYDTTTPQPSFSAFGSHNGPASSSSSPATPPQHQHQQLPERHDLTFTRRHSPTVQPLYTPMPLYKPPTTNTASLQQHLGPTTMTPHYYDDDLRNRTSSTTQLEPQW